MRNHVRKPFTRPGGPPSEDVRRTAHTIRAAEGGGRFLTLMVPGGLEEMFSELGQLPPNAIRDPEARAAISARYDSIPVQL